MRVNKKYIELILIVALYLTTIYLWSMPFQNDSNPYGDVDSSVHFSIGDYMAEEDKAIYYLPPYIDFAQGKWRNGKLWYPPQYHLDIALASIAGGERFLPVLVFFAITCCSFVLTSYLLFRKLFGFTIAFFSSFLLIFSLRDIGFYLFGLWPQVTSFAMTPLVLYTFYKYLNSTDKKQTKPIYLWLSSILLAVQFFIHPQGALLSGTVTIIFITSFILFRRKFPFNFKTTIIGLILLAVLIGPFYHFSLSSESRFSEGMGSMFIPEKLSNIVSWYSSKTVVGVPQEMMTFAGSHKGYWIVPFFLAGVIFLLFRRKNQDLLLLSWMLGFHFLTNFIEFRVNRMVEVEALFVYPIAMIGLVAMSQFGGQFIPKSKKIIKYVLIAVLLYFAISSIGVAGYNQLKNGYKGSPLRISEEQIEVGNWLKDNTQETDEVFYFGPYVYGKKKWIRAVAQRKMWFTLGHGVQEINKVNMSKDYFIVDYTDLIRIGSQQEISILQDFENKILTGKQKLYDKNQIKVYKLD